MKAWKTPMTRALILCLALGLLAGCSTLSEGECKVADWQAIGEEDGTMGQNPDYIASHRKACAKFGIAPDNAKYKKGYEEGLLRYCNEHNGFARGEQGKPYPGMCPAHLEAGFLFGYERGLILYGLTSEISAAKSSISEKQNSIKSLDKEIKHLEQRLIAGDITAEELSGIKKDIKEKRRLRQSLGNEIHTLEIDTARLEGELAGRGY